MRAPELVRQEVEAGHLVGNHTFTHLDLRTASKERIELELTATQRQIEAAAGRSTLLFRPPYDTDSEPQSLAQLAPLQDIDRMGYLVAGADVDSQDYLRPGADAIFANVMNDLAATGGRIVVFHDAGGDRSQTVAALDRLIPALRAAGYEIVPLDALAKVAPAALNPELSPREWLLSFGAQLPAWTQTSGAEVLVYLFAVTTAIAILRILFLGVLVARRPRPPAGDASSDFEPPICVLVPAYNEGRVISRTIEAALGSDYRRMRILVIDDGSTDDTASVVEGWMARDPRVALIRQRNAGKAAALNHGAREAAEEILVTIDADTLVLRHTISNLVKPFVDPKIDAVCGNVQVGNVCNLLTAFQSVEYVTSQNYDRRAFDSLNCISVVPGATGAWRRSTLLGVGGYSGDTLTEDADLTLNMLGPAPASPTRRWRNRSPKRRRPSPHCSASASAGATARCNACGSIVAVSAAARSAGWRCRTSPCSNCCSRCSRRSATSSSCWRCCGSTSGRSPSATPPSWRSTWWLRWSPSASTAGRCATSGWWWCSASSTGRSSTSSPSRWCWPRCAAPASAGTSWRAPARSTSRGSASGSNCPLNEQPRVDSRQKGDAKT